MIDSKVDAINETNKDDLRLAYQTTVSLIALVSQEIYSRSGAMLIVHGLFVTVVFNNIKNPNIALSLAIAGLVLCLLWFILIMHGLYYQQKYRSIAIKIENRLFHDSFSIMKNNDIGFKNVFARIGFKTPTIIIILIFVIIYFLIIWKSYF